jgi:hypothetical protein
LKYTATNQNTGLPVQTKELHTPRCHVEPIGDTPQQFQDKFALDLKIDAALENPKFQSYLRLPYRREADSEMEC